MQAGSKSLLPGILLLVALLTLGWVLDQMAYAIHWPGYLAMIVFYGAIYALGHYAGSLRQQSDPDQVLLAGRQLPLWVAVFTMGATWVGGGFINGTAEAAAAQGLVWVQAPWAYALSLILGGLLFARPMRQKKYHTLLDPFAERYGKGMSSLLFLPALMGEIFWTAAILAALGTTFGAVLGLDFTLSIIISAGVAIAYTAIGGLWAVALTDVMQMILLLLGLGLVLPFAISAVGGWDTMWQTYQGMMGSKASFLPDHAMPDFWLWIDFALMLILGGIPWQVYFQRVLAARDARTAVRLSYGAGIICLLAAIPPTLIGLSGAVADWSAFGAEAPENAALTLPYVVRYLSPTWVATIGLGAVAAAVMSSVDSSILSASSMATWNIYRPWFKPTLSPIRLSQTIRRCIWIVGITATLIALQVQSVYDLWVFCSDWVYVLLFPQLLCVLFDRKANRQGAFTGLVAGLVLRLLLDFRTPAMLGSLVSIWLFSRLYFHLRETRDRN